MSSKDYIIHKLQELKSKNKIDLNLFSSEELTDFIFKTLMSKKFRKFAINTEYASHINWAIKNSIDNNLPIKLVFPFGGYKLWRLEETPEVDWAELFTLMYYAKWLKPVVEVYKPGVWFDFCSDSVIVERMNNIPKEDTEKYEKSFNDVLDFLKNYLPENMKFTLTQVGSFYEPEEFEEDLKDKIEIIKKEFGGLPKLSEKQIHMVDLNVKLKDDQEKDPLWKEKVELIHQAYYAVSRRRPYSRSKEKILAFSNKMINCIPVGTTKTSIAKFWVGVGALIKKDDTFTESVLSPSQINDSSKFEPISIDNLNGKNFTKIRIIQK